MDATLFFALPKAERLIAMPRLETRHVSTETIRAAIIATWENVCECYDLDPTLPADPLGNPLWVVYELSAKHTEEAGMFKALAFGHLALACEKAWSTVEEFNGYPKSQYHMLQAAAWAAVGMLRSQMQ